jgi:hypothetical protein
LNFQGRWAFLFLDLPDHCPVGMPTLTPLALRLFNRWCSKVFGQLLGLGCLWLGLRVTASRKLTLACGWISVGDWTGSNDWSKSQSGWVFRLATPDTTLFYELAIFNKKVKFYVFSINLYFCHAP